MEMQVHGFDFGLDDGFVYDSSSCRVIGLDCRWWFFQPISINVWWMGTISLDFMYSAHSSASAAEHITNLIIWEIMRTDPFHLGVGLFSDKNMLAPARLRALEFLLNPASEWAARIISLAR